MAHKPKHDAKVMDVVDKFGRLRFYRIDLRKIYDSLEDALEDKSGEEYDLGS
jgi:hypothetical protein